MAAGVIFLRIFRILFPVSDFRLCHVRDNRILSGHAAHGCLSAQPCSLSQKMHTIPVRGALQAACRMSSTPDSNFMAELYRHLRLAESQTDDEAVKINAACELVSHLEELHNGVGTAVYAEDTEEGASPEPHRSLAFRSLQLSAHSYACTMIEFDTCLSSANPQEHFFVAAPWSSSKPVDLDLNVLLIAVDLFDSGQFKRISRHRFTRIRRALLPRAS
jgi:hypothetical protein